MIGDQAHQEHYLCLQRWLAGYPQATPSACGQMVSPLYLQHPGHTRLEEMMNAAMHWKGMHTNLTKSCRSCQTNKRRKLKYGHLPPKTIISNPWECLYVDLIGPYTLKGKDNLQIDFMALTMIDLASS
jgi:hypothetical protein